MEKKAFTLLLALAYLVLSGAGNVAAQDDYTLFRDGAGEASLLFRGHKSFDYNMLYNGTPFWTSPRYLPGSVVFNGKNYDGIELNIDAARQELIVRIGKGVSNKVLSNEFVSEFTIDGRRFLNLRYFYGEAAPSGYWEVLYDGRNKVVRRVTKSLEQDIDGTKRDETRFDGTYRHDVYQSFLYTENYCYLKEDGSIVPVRRRKDVLKLLDKTQRREARRHIREIESVNMLPFDLYFVEMIRYMESR
jgi:hypothetical protein